MDACDVSAALLDRRPLPLHGTISLWELGAQKIGVHCVASQPAYVFYRDTPIVALAARHKCLCSPRQPLALQ
jgi:hypothetical protein